MPVDPVEMLHRGVELLAPVLAPHGFAFEAGEAGKGSGGHFARGAFFRGYRRLELSTRCAGGSDPS